MSVKAMIAAILQNELRSRSVHSPAASDYEAIVELMIDRLRELELEVAARELTGKAAP